MKFDVVKYLNLKPEPQSLALISQELSDYLSQYLIIRLLEVLPEERVKSIKDPNHLFSFAEEFLPDFSAQIKGFLADFKAEYNQQLGRK